jgi:hypothetical protein
MTPIGWRLYYDDGSTYSAKDGPWERAPATGVQIAVVYYQETYACWMGPPETGHLERYNYRDLIHGARYPGDVYWMVPDGTVHGGLVRDVPVECLATIKHGTYVSDKTFRDIWNLAHQPRRWR